MFLTTYQYFCDFCKKEERLETIFAFLDGVLEAPFDWVIYKKRSSRVPLLFCSDECLKGYISGRPQ